MVHVDDIFAVGETGRCDQFGRDLNRIVRAKNLGKLRQYSGCCYERDWEKGNVEDFPSECSLNSWRMNTGYSLIRVSRFLFARDLRSPTRTKHQATGRLASW